ncbi:cation-translocating P-type ATPase, partial [Saprospiraceae bacterium]|nr:cation-translocating P-type ATPase [Saprospiraceae bacterium]
IFLLLVGRWIQFRQQNRAADSVEMLYRLTPKTTRKIVDGRVVETFVDMVQTDDLLEIRAGDLIPVDGVIVEGNSEIDESILTGESQLQPKTTGDQVLAGTQNQRSVLMVQATATGRRTRLSGIVDLVEQASLDKPEIVQWANRIGGYFVMAVILFAGLTLVGWLFLDAGLAVDRSVALLIVACPCALALATPLAISVALGRAAKTKIMVKGGDVLQRLNRPGMIWLDKTGTLTEGKMEVVRWFGDTRWRLIVAALESKSSHPVAAALVEHAIGKNEEPWPLEFENVQEESGSGISCTLHGRILLVGNAKLLLAHDVKIARRHQRIADRIMRKNLSPCWIAVDGKVVSIVALGDGIRPGTRSAIEQLKAKGWEVGILSGDHETIVHQVASRLGIDRQFALGGRSPEEKVDTVRDSFGDCSTVVMVGDGVNDSAALAAASVGIAVHNGAEASLAAAPVYLAEEGLQPILKLLQISNSTNNTIRKNFVASIGYNAFGATFAAIGWINPLVAAILMPISSLTVVAISLTAGKHK